MTELLSSMQVVKFMNFLFLELRLQSLLLSQGVAVLDENVSSLLVSFILGVRFPMQKIQILQVKHLRSLTRLKSRRNLVFFLLQSTKNSFDYLQVVRASYLFLQVCFSFLLTSVFIKQNFVPSYDFNKFRRTTIRGQSVAFSFSNRIGN